MLQSLPLCFWGVEIKREKSAYSAEPFRYASVFSFVFRKPNNYYGILIHREYSFKFRAVLLKGMYAATSPFT